MTIPELKKMLEKSGLPVAYRQFEQDEDIGPPFIIIIRKKEENVFADDKVYQKIQNCFVELYTDNKDIELENIIEQLFDDNEIIYEAEETYIESEKMYEVVYDIQIL